MFTSMKFATRFAKHLSSISVANANRVKAVSVPGLEAMGMMVIMFPDKRVTMSAGIAHDVTVCETNNPEFANVYGDSFIAVGKNFLRCSNKEQQALIVRELLFAAMAGSNQAIDALDNLEIDSTLTGRESQAQIEAVNEEDAIVRIVLARYFGKHLSNVICDERTAIMKRSIQMNMKAAAKAGKAEKVAYTKPEKADLKAAKKENKSDRKDLLKDVKADKKAEKKENKAEKKADKADKKAEKKSSKGTKKSKKVDLEAEAEKIDPADVEIVDAE